MKNYKKIVVIILALIIVAGGVYWYMQREPIQYAQGLYPFSKELAGKTIVQSDYIRYPGKDGKTTTELLKNAIGMTSLASPDKDHVWNLYLNGKKQSDPPDKVMTRTGDIVEWQMQSVSEEIKF